MQICVNCSFLNTNGLKPFAFHAVNVMKFFAMPCASWQNTMSFSLGILKNVVWFAKSRGGAFKASDNHTKKGRRMVSPRLTAFALKNSQCDRKNGICHHFDEYAKSSGFSFFMVETVLPIRQTSPRHSAEFMCRVPSNPTIRSIVAHTELSGMESVARYRKPRLSTFTKRMSERMA